MFFTILLHEDVAVDPRRHGEVVARALAIPISEARMHIRKGRGIFLEHLPEDAARVIAEDLGSDGVRASVVRESDIPEIPKPRKVGRIERSDESLSYRVAGSEESGTIPWEALELVSLGIVAGVTLDTAGFVGVPALRRVGTEDREVLRENLIRKVERRPGAPLSRNASKSVFERIEEARLGRVFADLVTADLGTWLRVGMEEFGYVLAPGAVQMGASWGMDALMKDLRLRAAAALTDLTLRILAAADLGPLLFAQVEELNRHTMWAILLKHLGLEPEIPWAELDAGN